MPRSIVFCADNKFLPYVTTALKSLILNRPNNREPFKVYLYSADIPKEILAFFAQYIKQNSDHIKILICRHSELQQKFLDNLSLTSPYFSKALYSKLFLAEALAHEDEVIYMDSDVLFTDDITPLLNLKMDPETTLYACYDHLLSAQMYALAHPELGLKVSSSTLLNQEGNSKGKAQSANAQTVNSQASDSQASTSQPRASTADAQGEEVGYYVEDFFKRYQALQQQDFQNQKLSPENLTIAIEEFSSIDDESLEINIFPNDELESTQQSTLDSAEQSSATVEDGAEEVNSLASLEGGEEDSVEKDNARSTSTASIPKRKGSFSSFTAFSNKDESFASRISSSTQQFSKTTIDLNRAEKEEEGKAGTQSKSSPKESAKASTKASFNVFNRQGKEAAYDLESLDANDLASLMPYLEDSKNLPPYLAEFPVFSSGLMVLNLKRIRQEGYYLKYLKYLSNGGVKQVPHDQLFLNLLHRKEWRPLPDTYNFQVDYINQELAQLHADYSFNLALKIPSDTPKIIHFSGINKPLNKQTMLTYRSLFYKIYNASLQDIYVGSRILKESPVGRFPFNFLSRLDGFGNYQRNIFETNLKVKGITFAYPNAQALEFLVKRRDKEQAMHNSR